MSTIEERREYIATITSSKNVSDYLTKEDYIEIGNKFMRAGYDSMMKYPKSSACINLDLIDNESLITEVYNFILYKVTKQKS
jgi:hypothetical protein